MRTLIGIAASGIFWVTCLLLLGGAAPTARTAASSVRGSVEQGPLHGRDGAQSPSPRIERRMLTYIEELPEGWPNLCTANAKWCPSPRPKAPALFIKRHANANALVGVFDKKEDA